MTDYPLKTIEFMRQRAEIELPEQIERAEHALGVLTMRYYDQLKFDFEPQDG